MKTAQQKTDMWPDLKKLEAARKRVMADCDCECHDGLEPMREGFPCCQNIGELRITLEDSIATPDKSV